MVAWSWVAAWWPFATTSIRDHLQPFLLQRAVEAMVSGKTPVFKDEELQARSVELKPTKEEEKDATSEEQRQRRRDRLVQ